MSQHHTSGPLTLEQKGVLLDSTVRSIQSGLATRYVAQLALAPEILQDSLRAGREKDEAVELADMMVCGETALGFVVLKRRHVNVFPVNLFRIARVHPETGECMLTSMSDLGYKPETGRNGSQGVYPGFLEQDLVLADERIHAQEAAGLHFGPNI